MRRRQFITLLGGAAAWPLAAQAQQTTMPVIGYFSARSPETDVAMLAAFRRGLGETGYVEGRNVAIEFRWGGGQYERLPALAADLVRRQVAVIATSGGITSALAAKAATGTIPIVFIVGGDPVQDGLVTSLSRPGGHLTGLTSFANALETKELELLRELAPATAKIGMLLDPNDSAAGLQVDNTRTAARAMGLELIVVKAGTASDIEAAFATYAQQRAGALLVSTSPFYLTHPDQIVAPATVIRCRQCMGGGNTPRPAGSRAMAPIRSTAIDRSAPMSAGFSREKGRLTSPSFSRPSSSLSST
jgi:putative ABC transport system substrate-binding protein